MWWQRRCGRRRRLARRPRGQRRRRRPCRRRRGRPLLALGRRGRQAPYPRDRVKGLGRIEGSARHRRVAPRGGTKRGTFSLYLHPRLPYRHATHAYTSTATRSTCIRIWFSSYSRTTHLERHLDWWVRSVGGAPAGDPRTGFSLPPANPTP